MHTVSASSLSLSVKHNWIVHICASYKRASGVSSRTNGIFSRVDCTILVQLHTLTIMTFSTMNDTITAKWHKGQAVEHLKTRSWSTFQKIFAMIHTTNYNAMGLTCIRNILSTRGIIFWSTLPFASTFLHRPWRSGMCVCVAKSLKF